MKLLIIGHKYQYEMLKLTQIFYPNTKIDLLFSPADTGDDETVITTELTKDNVTVSFAEQKKQKVLTKPRPEKEDEERCMASMLFSLLCENTGYIPKWGMLTGIRPSKLFRGFAERYGEEKAKKNIHGRLFRFKAKDRSYGKRCLGRGKNNRSVAPRFFQPLRRNTVLPVAVQLLLICIAFNGNRECKENNSRVC